VTIILIKS